MKNTKQSSFVGQWPELPLTDREYLAYRQRVSDGIRKVRKQEKVARIVTQCAWALVAAAMLGGAIADFNRDSFPEMVRLYLIVATAISMACALVFLAIYLVNYRPRVRHAEQESMLLSLQRQLHELRDELQNRPGGPPPDSGSEIASGKRPPRSGQAGNPASEGQPDHD